MRECLSTDAIVTIGDALSWEVTEGLRHLQICDECRTQMETLQLIRAAFAETEPIDAANFGRISEALRAAGRSERARMQRAQRWANLIEPMMAGITALFVLISSGIEIGSIGAGLLTFSLGAAFLTCGRMLSRQLRPTS